MARKTVRIDQLPLDVRAELEAKQATEDATKRLHKLLTGNTRLLDAAVLVPADKAVELFTEARSAHGRVEPSEQGGE